MFGSQQKHLMFCCIALLQQKLAHTCALFLLLFSSADFGADERNPVTFFGTEKIKITRNAKINFVKRNTVIV